MGMEWEWNGISRECVHPFQFHSKSIPILDCPIRIRLSTHILAPQSAGYKNMYGFLDAPAEMLEICKVGIGMVLEWFWNGMGMEWN